MRAAPTGQTLDESSLARCAISSNSPVSVSDRADDDRNLRPGCSLRPLAAEVAERDSVQRPRDGHSIDIVFADMISALDDFVQLTAVCAARTALKMFYSRHLLFEFARLQFRHSVRNGADVIRR